MVTSTQKTPKRCNGGYVVLIVCSHFAPKRQKSRSAMIANRLPDLQI